MEENDLPVGVERVPPRDGTSVGIAIVGIFALVGVFAGVYLTSVTRTARPIRVAREAVKEYLKSPASAVFSDEQVTKIKGMSGVTVRGVVDSQNGFGAMLRSTWTVDVYNGDEARNVRITPKN